MYIHKKCHLNAVLTGRGNQARSLRGVVEVSMGCADISMVAKPNGREPGVDGTQLSHP